MIDPRLAELAEWSRESGLDLPMRAEDVIAWEDAGYIVVLTDGSLIDAPGSQPAYSGPDVEAWPTARGFVEYAALTDWSHEFEVGDGDYYVYRHAQLAAGVLTIRQVVNGREVEASIALPDDVALVPVALGR